MGRPARNLNQIPDLSNMDKAWIAGFLDGEGHIAIQRTVRSLNNMSYYTPIVQVAQAGEKGIALIHDLHLRLGGIGLVKAYAAYKKAHRPSAVLMVWGAEARALCEIVLPFLRLKQEQAKIIAEWPLRRTYSQGRKGTVMDTEMAATQTDLFHQVRLLNAFRLPAEP
jgi:hypothetical protein